jgi:LacI family transcriptional regulator
VSSDSDEGGGISAKKRATMKDVARAANVSSMTVSNVLNNRLQFVSSKTKSRVEREITRLNYRRQAAARNLRSAKQRSVGLIVVDSEPAFLSDYFTSQVAAGLSNVLNGAEYSMTVQGTSVDTLSDSMIMRNLDVEGFCAMVAGPESVREKVLKQLHSLGQPLILFQQNKPEKYNDVCAIRLDDTAGGRILGDHLTARGVRSIVALRPKQRWFAIDSRFAGLQDSLSRAMIKPSLTVVDAETESLGAVQNALGHYLESNPLPDAIVGGNDQIALAAMLLLTDRNHKVPEDILVAGFNGFDAHRYLRPQLTTVTSPAYQMGQTAGTAMLERLTHGAFLEEDFVLPVHFTPGGTT